MSVRIGVDVGGTFTKAVACDPSTGTIVARAVVPTTHGAVGGVAEGAVAAVTRVTDDVATLGMGPVVLVAHSTTQAVNSLLEGDTATVGVLGLGRRPDVRRAGKRTKVGDVRLAPGRSLRTLHRFLDISDGLARREVVATIRDLLDDGAEVICVSEAFGVDDARSEWMVLEVAAEMGVPACAGHELSGLYGLEMRTVTAALNASILPVAVRTARLVEQAIAERIGDVPLLVMRGDGGAADLATMKRHPLVTAFSGPAASVVGALRHLHVHDGVVIEVGGTSTNVSAVRGGRPVLSYVRVLEHVTCTRSLDVRVVGVAGGSLLRVGRRFGRRYLADVGPRSAHIAGLQYACFAAPEALLGAVPRLIAPKPGDPEDYLILEAPDGTRFAPTLTCAANACGAAAEGSYATTDPTAAGTAFAILERFLGTDPQRLAGEALGLAARKIAPVVSETASEQGLTDPAIVGLGGGAGALVPTVAAAAGSGWHIPAEAEVISSVGDALSLVRIEIERTLPKASPEAVADLLREAEEAAIAAGASPAGLQVESRSVPERGALRVAAFGSVALSSDATPLEACLDVERAAVVAKEELGDGATLAFDNDFYAVFTGRDGAFAVVDRHGALALSGYGTVVTGNGAQVAAQLQERIPRMVRHYGPIAVAPGLRVLRGTKLVDLTLLASVDGSLQAALAECARGNGEAVVAFLSR